MHDRLSDDGSVLALVERLYGGLTQTPPWEHFLQALAQATSATFATLIIGRGQKIDAHVTPGVDPGRQEEYRLLSQADPFVGLPEGRVVSFRDFVHHIPENFRDWMDISRTGQILGIDLQREPDIYVRLRLTRDDSGPDFTDAERLLLARLVPHLRVALDLHARLTSTEAESQLFSSAMADLAVATLILDRDGRVLHHNATAERMLQDENGALSLHSGKLEFATQAAAITMARVLSTPPEPGEETQFDIAGRQGLPLHARVRSIPSAAYGDGAWVALFLAAATARAQAPSADMLRTRFQLTPAESMLALQLVDGATLAEASQTLDIAYNTARSHLRAIFVKTGTHRQVELITLLRTIGSAGPI